MVKERCRNNTARARNYRLTGLRARVVFKNIIENPSTAAVSQVLFGRRSRPCCGRAAVLSGRASGG